MGLDPESDEAIHRDAIVEAIGAKYPEDSETGHPIGVKPIDTHLLRLLGSDTPIEPPKATFTDAVEIYSELKVVGTDSAEVKEKNIRRLAENAIEAWGKNKTLSHLVYQDGLAVKRYYEQHTENSPASIKRLFNDYKAVINHAMTVFSMPNLVNPFAKIPFKTEGRAKDKRRSFKPEELMAIRKLVLANAKQQPKLI